MSRLLEIRPIICIHGVMELAQAKCQQLRACNIVDARGIRFDLAGQFMAKALEITEVLIF
jgi:hypothetical protein